MKLTRPDTYKNIKNFVATLTAFSKCSCGTVLGTFSKKIDKKEEDST